MIFIDAKSGPLEVIVSRAVHDSEFLGGRTAMLRCRPGRTRRVMFRNTCSPLMLQMKPASIWTGRLVRFPTFTVNTARRGRSNVREMLAEPDCVSVSGCALSASTPSASRVKASIAMKAT